VKGISVSRDLYATKITERHGAGVAEGADTTTVVKDPKPYEKLLGYFPEGATALYASLSPLLDGGYSGRTLTNCLWGALAVSTLFNVLYLKIFWKVKRDSQIAISTLAFLVYMAALGGPFVREDWYSPTIAGVVAVVFSAFIIFMKAPTKPAEA
jgi:hypothetical protein